jgi:hypothetical protein
MGGEERRDFVAPCFLRQLSSVQALLRGDRESLFRIQRPTGLQA